MIEKHVCKNGLRIVSEFIPSVRSVTMGIWVLSGSRHETKETNGISHFIEHMFFKGTKSKNAQEIAEAFDSIGGQINAFTSKEYTCYYARVLDNHKEYALNLLADMFFNSIYEQDEMNRERKVVMEEIKMYEDTPDDIVHDLLARASYGDHPLGYPILGTKDQLDSFTKDTILDYIGKRYHPENVVISIAGHFDEQFIHLIDDLFGGYEKKHACEQMQAAPTFLAKHIKRAKETEQAHLTLGYNGLSAHDDSLYSMVVLNNVLGGSMSSRLFQEVREKRGLAYSVFSYHSSFLDNGLLTIYAGTGNAQLPLLKETIFQTIEELVENGITEKELRNSKEQLKGNIVLGLESTNSRMSRNGRNELLLGRHRTMDEVIHMIDQVTLGSTQAVIQRVFNQNYASALIAPEVKK
ncbi:MAG TPA: pitrilysin family protein [Cerasibacillus sp.]|uniref:M16 family metallopeptidase n=1 Tax=Cerasibacillus sp. TaxID=2498711 RepID=UPI002F3F0A1F